MNDANPKNAENIRSKRKDAADRNVRYELVMTIAVRRNEVNPETVKFCEA